jgi:hypothetical protein
MNFYKNITYVGTPEIVVKANGNLSEIKNTLTDLNNFSILHNIAFQFSKQRNKTNISTKGTRY